MKIRIASASLLVAALAASATFAQSQCGAQKSKALVSDDGSAKAGACCWAQKSATCEGKSGRELVKAAGVTIPAMHYRVADQTTPCSITAGKLAKGNKSAIKFVVADEVFETEADARKAHAKVLNAFLNRELTTVRFAVGQESTSCPMTAASLAKKEGKPMRYRVAAFDFKSQKAADRAIELAKEAATKVKFASFAGKSDCCLASGGQLASSSKAKAGVCPASGAALASAQSKKPSECAGKDRAQCQASSSVELAQARIDAALDVLAEAARG